MIKMCVHVVPQMILQALDDIYPCMGNHSSDAVSGMMALVCAVNLCQVGESPGQAKPSPSAEKEVKEPIILGGFSVR